MNVTVSDEVREKMEERKAGKMEKWEKDLEKANRLEDVFHDTLRQCDENPVLKNAVMYSRTHQEVIWESDRPDFGQTPLSDTNVVVTREKTFEAARVYAGRHIAVLNFASPFSPGGIGDVRGLTQEECLCRESTLYSCISFDKCLEEFYDRHKGLDDRYNADMIYTPDVKVFKTYDQIPKDMPEKEWFNVDIITMAAPNISHMNKGMDEEQASGLVDIFEDRFTRILYQAWMHGAEHVVLGAFGCGAFSNDPVVVATGAARALDKFGRVFDTIHFAIYEPRGRKNFHTFRMVLDRYLNNSQAGE